MSKKIICIALLGSLILSITGCEQANSTNSGNYSNTQSTSDDKFKSDETQETVETGSETAAEEQGTPFNAQTELTNNGLFDYEILVDGQVISLPVNGKILAQMGYKSRTNRGKSIKPGAGSVGIDLENIEKGFIISSSCYENIGGEAIDFYEDYANENLVFYGLGVNYQAGFEIAGGITQNSTADDLVAAFGEPDYVDIVGGTVKWYYYYDNPEDREASGYVAFQIPEEKVTKVKMEKSK